MTIFAKINTDANVKFETIKMNITMMAIGSNQLIRVG